MTEIEKTKLKKEIFSELINAFENNELWEIRDHLNHEYVRLENKIEHLKTEEMYHEGLGGHDSF